MIKMWDTLFATADPKIGELWHKLAANAQEETARQIYHTMHEYLGKVWLETYRVLADGGIACINIGDATRRLNGKFQLFPNHSRVIEICEKSASQHSRTSCGKNPQPNRNTRVKAPF